MQKIPFSGAFTTEAIGPPRRIFGHFYPFWPFLPLLGQTKLNEIFDHLRSCRSAPAPAVASPSLSSTAALPLAVQCSPLPLAAVVLGVLAVLYIATWPPLAKLDKVFSVEGSIWGKHLRKIIMKQEKMRWPFSWYHIQCCLPSRALCSHLSKYRSTVKCKYQQQMEWNMIWGEVGGMNYWES